MSYTPTKDELKIYSRLWKSVEALWIDLYESGMTQKEIREEFKNIMSGMVLEMEKFEREVSRELSPAERRELR